MSTYLFAMRVVHLCNLPLFPGHPDFDRLVLHPGRWVLNLALAQRREENIDARLLVQVPGASADYVTEVEGVPVQYIAAPDRFRAATFFWLDRRRLAREVEKLEPSLVHAHGTEEANLLAAQSTGRPSLVTIQGLIALINERVRPGLVSRYRITEFTERLAMRKATHAIAKSSYIAGELKRRFPKLQIHRIPNTFDPALLEIPDSPKENAIAFVGTLDPRKGIHLIASAMEILRKIPENSVAVPPVLHVYGDRPNQGSSYEEDQKNRLRQLLGDRVVFHGTVAGIEVARGVSRVRALVAPSLEEMFGNQLIEALLVGTHAIVADQTAMADNVRTFGNGTVVPQEDPQALAAAITAACKRNASEGGWFSARDATANVVAAMGPAAVAAAHRQLYEKILREHRA